MKADANSFYTVKKPEFRAYIQIVRSDGLTVGKLFDNDCVSKFLTKLVGMPCAPLILNIISFLPPDALVILGLPNKAWLLT